MIIIIIKIIIIIIIIKIIIIIIIIIIVIIIIKVCDTVASIAVYNDILTGFSGDADQARLKAVNSPHAGDWLKALPIASVGLRHILEICWRELVMEN